MLFKLLLITWLTCLTFSAHADDDPFTEDRKQLRQILAESQRGINTQTLSLFTQHIDPQARVTFLNKEVVIGPNGVKDYFDRMVGENPNAVLTDYKTQAEVIDQARFYGNVAVANGVMQDTFTPKSRGTFAFDSVWTATFAKQNDTWKIIALHFSTNAFNNSLTDELKHLINRYAAIAFFIGLILGAITLILRQKYKQSNQTKIK